MSNVLIMDSRQETGAYLTIDDFPEVMKVKDVKEYLRIGENATYDFLNNPKCPTFRIGSSIRIRKEKLLKFVDDWENGEV